MVITSRSDPSLSSSQLIDGCIDVTRVDTGTTVNKRDQILFQAVAKRFRDQRHDNLNVVQTIKADRRTLPSLWQIKRNRKKLIYVSTMVEAETWGRTSLHRWLNLQMQRFSLSLFDAVVVGSNTMAEVQRRFGVSERKLHIISHGVDIARFRNSSEPRPELLSGLPGNAKICLYVGHIIPRKGVSILVKAWADVAKKHPDAWLVLLGSVNRPTVSSAQEMQEIQSYQRALFNGIDSASRILHFPPQSDIQRWFQAADVFLFPSKQEGFPNALLEAMSSMLPCLTNRFVGFPEGQLGDKTGAIQVIDGQEDEWARVISNLLDNDELRVRMGCTARKIVVEDHALGKTLDKYASLYLKLANNSSAR